MNVQILHLIEGAKAARGLTVIIDVFRAFSVEAYFFAKGANAICPVGDIEIARRLKSEFPEAILAGERHGKILPGFDVGNSPTDIMSMDTSGKLVIHTTSAGTQGIANAIHADEVLGGCLLNARATADYIRRSGANEVSLVCMGLEAMAPADEDTLCANYIKSILEGTHIDIASEIEKLKYTTGAKFFDATQNDVFPQNDFFMCTAVDKFDFIMRMQTEDGKNHMKKHRS